jgi:uncharacterized protein (DUF4415 family)
VKISYDPKKNARNVAGRSLSFERAADLEWEMASIMEDARENYPERRFVATGYLDGRRMCCASRPPGMASGSSVFAKPTNVKRDAMKKRRKPLIGPDGEVRELTKADIARMRPAAEVVPQVVEAWRRTRGRPPKEITKRQVTLRLSPEVLAYFRAQGSGWQTRIDEVLNRYVARKKAA